MADEIKDTDPGVNDAAGSNSATPSAQIGVSGPTVPASPAVQQNPVEEARIIDEIVVKPAPKQAVAAPAPASIPEPIKPVVLPPVAQAPQPSAPPVKSQVLMQPPTAPQIPQKPVPPPLAAAPPAPIPPAKVPEMPIPTPKASASGLEVKPSAPIQVSERPPMPISQVSQNAKQDIAQILKETKLPERSPVAASAPEPKGRVFDTTLGAAATIALDDKKPETLTPSAPAKPAQAPTVSPLRTLKGDLQEIVQEKKISLVRAAALEQEKKRGANSADPETPARKSRTAGILFTAALLVVLGGGALFGVYVVMQGYSAAPSTNNTSILFAESTLALPLENQSPLELKRLLAQARTTSGGTLGSITQLVPLITETGTEGTALERPATLEEFFEAIGARTSGDLARALSNEFFFGIHTVDENAPLFVIPVLSYERAFAGMLSWEQTMNADLAPAFTQVPVQTIGPSGLPEKRLFEDVVMRNYDVRALKDDAGEIQLYYSFPTRSILIISESPFSFTEILSRLRAERKL